ncbi:transglutaminase-like domain-containing protein [Thermogladius sp. 4427co]|uniref:transglutaminase-like domain-containing protein n=1 Tax=Thermogladius sp. 4427co TaxID=3450718 RepID=UPI003F7972F1
MDGKYLIAVASLTFILLLFYHIQTVNNLNSTIANLSRKVDVYKSEIARLNSTIVGLKSNLTSLESQLESYKNAYNKVLEWFESNISYYKSLVSMYENQISQLNRSLEENRTYYIQLISNLTAELDYYKSLVEKLNNELQTLNNWLKGNTDLLINQLVVLQDELHSLKAYLSTPIGVITLITNNISFINSFLLINIELIRGLELNLTPGSIPFNIVNYTLLNFYYQFDPVALRDYWKPVNETLLDHGGDCEDLALFIYSYLYAQGFNKTFLIAFQSNGYGHVAVASYINNTWYLIDPAGNWFNGYNAFIIINIKDSYTIRIPPLLIYPSVKKWLLQNGFAVLDFIPFRQGAPSNLQDLVTSWSQYWSSLGYPQERYFIISLNVFKVSNSLSDLYYQLESLASR